MRLRTVITIISLSFSLLLSAQINAERMMIIGRNALSYDDYALSIQYFSQVISAKPHLYEPYFFRGLAKFYLEDYTGAETDCSKSILLNPYYANSYEVRGLSRINLKDFWGAAMDYEEAIQIDDSKKSIWHNLVLCYLELDSLNKADSALVRFIDKWPKHAEGYLLKAEALLKEGDTIAAEQYADKALDCEKYNPQALSFKAAMLMKREEFAEAETTLDEAIRLQPKDVRNIINRALCRFQQNNYRGAMSDYDLVLDLDPTNFVGHYNRGLLRASVGEDNKAIEDFDFILERDPDDIMTLFNRARLYDQTGDYQSAIRDYTKVIEEFPKFLYGYQLRAEARRKIGDTRGAMKDEEHILRENIAHRYGYSTPTSRQKNRTRKKSQVDPNDFQQLVEEDNTKEYEDEFRGKIQNKAIDMKLLPIVVLTNDANTANESVLNDYTIEAYRISKQTISQFQQGIDYCIQADEERLRPSKSPLKGDLTTDNSSSLPLRESGERVHSQSFKLAADAFKRCTTEAPQFAEAFYNYAYTLAMQGKYNEAIENLTLAISKKNSFALAYYNRGILYLYTDNQTAAVSDLSKAGELGIYQAYSIIKQSRKKK